MKCKVCGKELEENEFTKFFGIESFEICSDECTQKLLSEKEVSQEEKDHPDWYGPVNQSEPY